MADSLPPERLRRWLARDLITLGWVWLDDVNEVHGQWGMNYADEMVLGTLVLDRGGRCRPKDLELPIPMAPSTLTKSMGRLEEAGYVTRETDPGDRRALWLVATDRGREVIAEILPALDKIVESWLSNLTRTEERQLRGLLDKLRER